MLQEKNMISKVLNFVYNTSKQPILLKDLLVASRQFNNGMEVDAGRLGFRLKLARAYFVYIVLILAILIPISLLTHKTLAIIDPHISIVGGMVVTALIFIGFNFFRDKIKEMMTQEVIKKAWRVHFPFFAYEEYSKKVNQIFEEAMREEIPKRDLQKYILDKVSTL
ncbi:hypothetical protein ACNSOS_06100 [Aliarcobacter vitoriensis]|uniref:Uncharacterized protein n=1 Tax=Aliarcobacter vitoriensis TaxID=2011099 RepID=A0A366MT39_9BACT|nr:hypothetical protein [Aliarcobacter vitoriensis]RBQ28552.1 hypothetical protein CRU91_08555 [Aliarcobacter vitoriensis]